MQAKKPYRPSLLALQMCIDEWLQTDTLTDQTELVSFLLEKCQDDYAHMNVPITAHEYDKVIAQATRYYINGQEFTETQLYYKKYALREAIVTRQGYSQPHEDLDDAIREIEIAGAEPVPYEISRWLVVGKELADELYERGEVILQNKYGTWWGVRKGFEDISLHPTMKDLAFKQLTGRDFK